MTASKGLFVRQTGTAPTAVGTTPIEARLALAGLVAENSPGVPRNGLLIQANDPVVTGSASNMSYDIKACNPVYNRAAGEGVYAWSMTGVTNIVTTAAPGSNSRYDLVYLKQNDPDKADADNLPVVGVIQGTAAPSPTKPYASVPAGGYVLAEALVASGQTTSSQATITQVWRHTVPRGAPIPVRNITERAEITPYNGSAVQRLDIGARAIEYSDGTTWTLTGVPQYAIFTASQAVPATSSWGPGALTLDAVNSQNAGIFTSPAADKVQASAAGVFTINMHISGLGAGGGWISVRDSAGAVVYALTNFSTGGEQSLSLPDLYLPASTPIKFLMYLTTGATVATTIRITKTA